MTQRNPIRLFVTHAWQPYDDYTRLFEFLESSNNFYYKNVARPEENAPTGVEAARESLRKQIFVAEVTIALTSLYFQQPDLTVFQMNYTQSLGRPVILLRPFGSQANIPKLLQERADDVIGWEERGLIDAIRRLARKEDTTRLDVVDFNPDDFKDFKRESP